MTSEESKWQVQFQAEVQAVLAFNFDLFVLNGECPLRQLVTNIIVLRATQYSTSFCITLDTWIVTFSSFLAPSASHSSESSQLHVELIGSLPIKYNSSSRTALLISTQTVNQQTYNHGQQQHSFRHPITATHSNVIPILISQPRLFSR
jgi:hypothetical protein